MSRFFSGVFSELIGLLPALPAILWAISFHEFCHGWVAERCGDSTARNRGRLTLNPLAHFDIWGLLCMFFFHIGWAKPVPIDPYNFKHPRRDVCLVSLAGAAGNLLTALFFSVVIRIMVRVAPVLFFGNIGLRQVLLMFVIININFAIFNLLPIPPLDGSKLLCLVLPSRWLGYFASFERYSFIILLLLVYSGIIGRILTPIGFWVLRILL